MNSFPMKELFGMGTEKSIEYFDFGFIKTNNLLYQYAQSKLNDLHIELHTQETSPLE